MNLISLFSSGFYVVSLFCPVPCLSPSDGSTGRGLQTNLTRSGKKAFPLLFLPPLSRIPFSFPITHPWQDFGESRFPRGGQIRIPSRNFEFTRIPLCISSKSRIPWIPFQTLSPSQPLLGLSDTDLDALIRSPGVLNKFLYREAPHRGPTPYPFIYRFHEKDTPSYTFYWQTVPLSHTLFRTLHPFQLL